MRAGRTRSQCSRLRGDTQDCGNHESPHTALSHCPPHCPLPTAHCPLLTAHCLLHTAHCLFSVASIFSSRVMKSKGLRKTSMQPTERTSIITSSVRYALMTKIGVCASLGWA